MMAASQNDGDGGGLAPHAVVALLEQRWMMRTSVA
jgi:hypothetical protein